MKNIVIIHGWDPLMYNEISAKKGINDPWYHRQKLIEGLEKNYNVIPYLIPGFCGRSEPNVSFWSIEDFSKDFNDWLISNDINPDLVLGYSFGGAIALKWKLLFKKQIKIILVSSALYRRSTKKSTLGKFFGFLSKIPLLGNLLKHIYLLAVSKYYRLGTPFLRKSYNSIVREDLSKSILEIQKNQALFIYGDNDTATPWSNISEQVIKSGNPFYVIEGGGHNIGQTHPEEVLNAITVFEKGGTE